MSSTRSTRIPGASVTRPPSGACGATGWPSIATTAGAWPAKSSAKTRALAALTSLRRRRSPLRTAYVSGMAPLIVTVLPTRPPCAASWMLPKSSLSAPSGVMRQSSSTQVASRSARIGSASSTISGP